MPVTILELNIEILFTSCRNAIMNKEAGYRNVIYELAWEI
jgi:hypothetical protein